MDLINAERARWRDDPLSRILVYVEIATLVVIAYAALRRTLKK